jgi:hypothetical protein
MPYILGRRDYIKVVVVGEGAHKARCHGNPTLSKYFKSRLGIAMTTLKIYPLKIFNTSILYKKGI